MKFIKFKNLNMRTMNTKYKKAYFLLILLSMFSARTVRSQSDVSLILPLSSITETLQTLSDGRVLNIGGPFLYSRNGAIFSVHQVGSLSLSPPNNTLRMRISGQFRGNQSTGGGFSGRFSIDIVGQIALINKNTAINGQPVLTSILKLTNARGDINTLSVEMNGGPIPNLISSFLQAFIIDQDDLDIDDLTLFNFSELLSRQGVSYFTTNAPTVEITSDEIRLGLKLDNLPRFVTIQNDYSGNTNIRQIEHLENNSFVSYNSPQTFNWSVDSDHIVRAEQGTVNYNEVVWKFKNWERRRLGVDPDITRQNPLSIRVSTDEISTARFLPAQQVTINNNLEGGLLSGGNATIDGVTDFVPFTDYVSQNTPISISSSITSGYMGTNWVFQNWSDNVSTNNRFITTSSPLSLTANWKGIQVSTLANATQQGGQRRFGTSQMRSAITGTYHIYESFGKIWLERSSDGGQTWTNQRFLGDGKNPALCCPA
jgi:hypothetical protein